LSTPFGALTPGRGQVVSVGAMNSSIVNGAFGNWLANALSGGPAEHAVPCGGEARLTSTCSRQRYGAPAWSTCGSPRR
jgi:hypothetical protein